MILTGGDGVGLGGRLFQAREHEEQLTGMQEIWWSESSESSGGNTEGESGPGKGAWICALGT